MPKRFFFWDALPKSGYGKIPKRLVRDELEARGLLDVAGKAFSSDSRDDNASKKSENKNKAG